MRIQNTSAGFLQRSQSIHQSAIRKNTEKLSTGYKINRAGDDAAGLAVSIMLSLEAQGMTQAAQNTRNGVSMVQTSEAALSEVNGMVNRMSELSVRAANGTYSEQERQMYQAEMDQLSSEITRIASSTNFNGIHNLSGEGSVTLQIGPDGDASQQLQTPSYDMRAAALGVEGLSISSSEDAMAAIGKLKDATNKISDARGQYGAIMNRLDHTENNLLVGAENHTESASLIRDTDVAEEMANFTRNSILDRMSMAMRAQANQNMGTVLRLIGA